MGGWGGGDIVCLCSYVCISTINIYIYIYIYRERERGLDSSRGTRSGKQYLYALPVMFCSALPPPGHPDRRNVPAQHTCRTVKPLQQNDGGGARTRGGVRERAGCGATRSLYPKAKQSKAKRERERASERNRVHGCTDIYST